MRAVVHTIVQNEMARTIPFHTSHEHYIAYLPEIIEAVLCNLSAKCLYTTAQVNRSWHLVSRHLLRTRNSWAISRFEHHTIYSDEVERFFDEAYSDTRVTMLFSHREVWSARRDSQMRTVEERRVERSVNNVHRMSPRSCVMVGCSTERIIVQYPPQ